MPRKKKIETTRVDGNALIKVMEEESGSNTFEVNWNGVNITVRKTLPISDMLAMVRDIVVSCYTDDDKYIPEVFDFAVAVSVLSRYANIDMPKGLDDQYDLVMRTDLYSKITKDINICQLNQIVDAANAQIKQINNEHMNFVMARISELSESLEAVSARVKEVFDGVTGDDLQKVVKAIGENGLDVDTIVQSYIDKTKTVATSTGVL